MYRLTDRGDGALGAHAPSSARIEAAPRGNHRPINGAPFDCRLDCLLHSGAAKRICPWDVAHVAATVSLIEP